MSTAGNDTGARRRRLILFVTGDAPRSRRARTNLSRALADLGADTAGPDEIDLLAEPQKTTEYGVFATPALLHLTDNGEAAVLYGDLSDTPRLRQFLSAAVPPAAPGP